MGFDVFLPECIESMVCGVEPAMASCLFDDFSNRVSLFKVEAYLIEIFAQILLLYRGCFVPIFSNEDFAVRAP